MSLNQQSTHDRQRVAYRQLPPGGHGADSGANNMTYRPAFRINERADREQASDGISRYGAYLAQHRRVFCSYGPDDPPTDDAVEYALSAWQVAGPPIMAPGFVSWHPRIQATSAHRDDDHRAALAVEIAVPAPLSVTAALTIPWREWAHDSWLGLWSDPWDNDRLTVMTTLTVRIPLSQRSLPAPRYRQGIPCTGCAKYAVGMLCVALNTELDSVLAALETPASHVASSTSSAVGR